VAVARSLRIDSSGTARVAAALSEVAARLDRELADALEAECTLPLVWFDVLRRIDATAEGFIALGRLAEEIVLSTGGVTRLVDRMEVAGLIERSACPTDRRSTFVKLTADGAALFASASAVYARRSEELIAGVLGERRAADLERAANALGESLRHLGG